MSKKAAKSTKKTPARKAPARNTKRSSIKNHGFLDAFIALLDDRGLRIPKGLKEAPPEAYASQDAEVVQLLAKLSDQELTNQADRIAGYSERRLSRAKSAWNTSPLIVELRRRKLKEPPAPDRVIGAAISFKKPLHEWTDREVLEAAQEWSRRGRS